MRLLQRYLHAAYGDIGIDFRVSGEHGAVIHFIDVIPGQDQHIFGVVGADNVDVLVNRIRGSRIPGGFQALLRRQQFHELSEFTAHKAPAALDVLDQAVGLVLCEYAHFANAGVDAVRQGEVDNAELTAKGDRWLGAPHGQLFQPGAASSGQHQGQSIPRQPTDISC